MAKSLKPLSSSSSKKKDVAFKTSKAIKKKSSLKQTKVTPPKVKLKKYEV